MTDQQETEGQRAQRSALGGFERDAKTFQGHLERISASAEAFVKRCAKFALQEPGHRRLAETAELLAEAKRIIGQEGRPVAAIPAPELPGGLTEDVEAAERLAGIETALALCARWIVRSGSVTNGQDDAAAVSGLRAWLAEPASVDAGTEVASMDARAGVPALVAQSDAAGWAAPAGLVPPPPALAAAYANGEARDPLANLQPDAAARVQAALDAAAAKAAPVNPLASYFAQQQ